MALQKCLHEFHAHRDYAMSNIQSRTIPVVRLTLLQQLSTQNFKALVLSKAYSNAKCFGTKWQHRQRRCLAGRVSFSGSCSRCLLFSPSPCPTLPKESMHCNACMQLWWEGGVGCTWCCAMSPELMPRSCMNICDQGCGRCAHQPMIMIGVCCTIGHAYACMHALI
jgi:hypothetical protein